MKTVAIIGTFDTKGEEFAYVKARFEELGINTLTIHCGVFDPQTMPDVPNTEVAAAVDIEMSTIVEKKDRAFATETMTRGVEKLLPTLYANGRFDGVFSMGGDIAKLPEICALAKQYGARVMVDDAHGLGVLGEGGRGTASYFGLEDQVDVYMGTFSKSLASLGGYMAASEEVAEYVRHASRPFIFSASIPPANCATALAALRHLEQHPELVDRLRSLSLYARKGMTDRGLKIRESALNAPTPIIPIYTYETYHTLEVAKEIYDRGVYVNPTLPPATPEGEALLRTSYMATHTDALLDEAMDIMAEVLVKHE